MYSSDGKDLAVSSRDGFVPHPYTNGFELIYPLSTVSIFKTVDLFTSSPWDRSTLPPKARLHAAPPNAEHAAGTVLWGCGPTERLIYTSSEPHDLDGEGKVNGHHSAFDMSRGELLFRFDAKESGDAGAISPDGESVYSPMVQ